MRHFGRLETFVVSLLTVASLLGGAAAAAPPPADSAGASPRLKYLPKNYWLVAECDCRTVMKFMTSDSARKNPQYAQFEQSMQLVKLFTGIEPEKEVDWITLFAAGTPEEAKLLVVVQGSFPNDLVAKRLALNMEGSILEKIYKRRTIYSFANIGLCFPEASTILVGDEALLREAIDQRGVGPRPLPEALKGVLDRTPGKSLVWGAVRPQVLLDHKGLADWRAGNGGFYRALKKIDCLSLSFDVSNDGLLIKGLGYVAAPGEANCLHRYLSDRKKNLLHEEGSNVLFSSLLILSEVKASDSYVEGSFRLTGQAFKELWETKVTVRGGAPAGGAKDR